MCLRLKAWEEAIPAAGTCEDSVQWTVGLRGANLGRGAPRNRRHGQGPHAKGMQCGVKDGSPRARPLSLDGSGH